LGNVRRRLVLCVLGICLVGLVVSVDRTEAAPHGEELGDQQVIVNPAAISYDEEVEISVKGLPPDYTLPPSALTLDGLRVPMPGYFGAAGEPPKSDKLGNVTFRTFPPVGTPLGSNLLTVEIEPLFFASTNLEFRGAPLTLSPRATIANQTIEIRGSGFSPASIKGGLGPEGVHQITGAGQSVITLNGDVLRTPYVKYPIDLDKDGKFLAEIVIPPTKATIKAGNLQILTTDTGGRSGSAQLTILSPRVVFEPVLGYPGENIRMRGSGFPASSSTDPFENTVDIEYRYAVTQQTGARYYIIIPLRRSIVDESGAFINEFIVPQGAGIPSSNLVVVRPKLGESITVSHNVPGPAVSVNLRSAFYNEAVVVTVKGFPPNYVLPAGGLTLGGVRMPLPGYFGVQGSKPTTDTNGQVTFETVVPTQMPSGLQVLQILPPSGDPVTTFLKVSISSLTITPLTAVPGQTVIVSSSNLSPADAVAPGPSGNHQISGKNLSQVTLGSERIGGPHVTYPIDLETGGDISFPLVVPTNDMTKGGGQLEIMIIDTGGRKGIGTLTIKQTVLTVIPASSARGSLVGVMGEGFVAEAAIDIDYDGKQVATATSDSQGSFQVTFRVPVTTTPGSTSAITATIQQLSLVTRSIHAVPGPAVTVYPNIGPPGTLIWIKGSGFRGFANVLPKLNNMWQSVSPSVHTDINGNFIVSLLVPAGFPPLPVDIGVLVGTMTKSTQFLVTKNP